MAKRVTRSQNPLSSSVSVSDKASDRASNETMALLSVKASEGTGRLTRAGRDNEKEKILKTAKRPKMKQKKKIDKFDAKKPKKPPTAFFYFLDDFRKEFQELNPDVKTMRDIGKACGEKWKTMTYEEKVKYYDIATEKRAEFDRAMAGYLKKKDSGGDRESEEDSDFDD